MKAPLAYGLIGLALILGIGLGYALTPAYAARTAEGASMGGMGSSAAPARPADPEQAWLAGMTAHHQATLALAETALAQSAREEIRSLAAALAGAKRAELAQMDAWAQAWFSRPAADLPGGMAMSAEALGTADAWFDLRWLNALDRGLHAALHDSEDYLAQGRRNETLTQASELRRAVQGLLKTVTELRRTLYLEAAP